MDTGGSLLEQTRRLRIQAQQVQAESRQKRVEAEAMLFRLYEQREIRKKQRQMLLCAIWESRSLRGAS